MSNIKALRQRAHDLKTKMRVLLDKAGTEAREFTEAESAEYETHLKAINGLSGQLEREERQLELERNGQTVDDPNVEAARRAGDTSAQKPGFKNFGEQLRAIVFASRSENRIIDPRLMATASGASEAVPSDGGFLVQRDFASEIVSNIFEGGELLSRVRRQGVTGNGLKMNAVDETSRADGSRWGGILAYWANEADTVTAKKPKFRQINLTLNKLFGLYYATDELLEDAPALAGMAQKGFVEELTFKAEDAVFEGDGSGKPQGIMNSGAALQVSKESSQAADTVVSENVLKMYSRMPARSRANAVWLTNQNVMPQLPQLNIKVKNAAGTDNVGGLLTPIYQFPNGDGYGTILGRPVIPIEYAGSIGDVGDLVFADLSQYLLIDKGGVESESSMHVRFLYDEMTFRITWRLDGQPIWNSPLTPFKGGSSYTVSPFVYLEAR